MEAQKGTRGTNLPEAKAIVHFCSQMLNYFDIILISYFVSSYSLSLMTRFKVKHRRRPVKLNDEHVLV